MFAIQNISGNKVDYSKANRTMSNTPRLSSTPPLNTHPLAQFFQLYDGLEAHMQSPGLSQWLTQLPEQIAAGLNVKRWGDIPRWYQHWQNLPTRANVTGDFTKAAVTLSAHTANHDHSSNNDNDSNRKQSPDAESLKAALMGLHPWRKGPFEFFELPVDTEWRSCLKWDRIAPHVDLQDKHVLDVGCGNGYYGWRMLGAGARSVIGIDPSPRFVLQWGCVRRYCLNQPCFVLPLGIEHLPAQLQAFDITFSMGVLYHRKSHFDHLYQLKETLKPGGHLVLETLVIPGPLGMTLLPASRYAKMRNVWELPSTETLTAWLKRCGYINITLADESITTIAEQRRTDWMQFESLADFLDPEDHTKTIEGYPAPRRAVLIAQKPQG